jgi:hypothetical protein
VTILQWYLLVGVPALLLLGGYAATRLAAHDQRQDRLHPGE